MEVFWALPYFLGAVAVHALGTRIPRGNPIVKFLLVGGTGGLALAGHLLAQTGPSLAALAALLAYAFACELYLFLFTLVASSVSVRLLLFLRERDLTAAQIQDLYAPGGMVSCRLERLVSARLLQQDGGTYRVSERGRRVVSLFLALRRFFRHPEDPPSSLAA